MSLAAVRGTRTRWSGWMRPSVAKVGAVQVGTGVLAVGALFTGVSWLWWGLALLGYFFYACVGHSVGYHRYFAHRSFRAPRWAEVVFTVAGTLGCVGSPVGWAQMHHRHHRYSDREGDPYTAHRYPRPSPRALLMSGYGSQPGSARALRRMFRADPLQVFVMRYCFGIVAVFAGSLLLLDWRLFLYGWAVPVAWTLWMAGLDAWATHRHGYRNHDTPDGSRNLWQGKFLFGELLSTLCVGARWDTVVVRTGVVSGGCGGGQFVREEGYCVEQDSVEGPAGQAGTLARWWSPAPRRSRVA